MASRMVKIGSHTFDPELVAIFSHVSATTSRGPAKTSGIPTGPSLTFWLKGINHEFSFARDGEIKLFLEVMNGMRRIEDAELWGKEKEAEFGPDPGV